MTIKSDRAMLTGPIGKIGPFVRSGQALLVALLLGLSAEAQIGVSPPRTEFSLDGPSKTHSIRVFNLGEKAVDIAIEVSHWDLDESNNVRIIPPTEQSLDQWLVINPLRFTLEPGGSQAVRFAARPRVKPEPGEHRALIYFQQEPDAADPATPAQPQILFRLGTSVIGLAEPIDRDAVVHSVTVEAGVVTFDVESRGNTHVRLDGQWALWSADRFPGHENTSLIEGLGVEEDVVLPEGMVVAWPLSPLPVLPGTRRMVTTEIGFELDPGVYVLDLHGTLSGMDIGQSIVYEVVPDDETETATPPIEGAKEEVGEADRLGEPHEIEPPSSG